MGSGNAKITQQNLAVIHKKFTYGKDGNDQMEKHKVAIVVLFIIFALPIPVSLLSWIGTIISAANIGVMDSTVHTTIALSTMLLAGTYPVSYIVALVYTLKSGKISLLSFLPLLHIVLFRAFFAAWSRVT